MTEEFKAIVQVLHIVILLGLRLLYLLNGGLNNGWNLIMENITCGDGNHE